MVTGGVVAKKEGKTGWEAFGYILLGGAIGLAAGGLVIATAGAIFGAINGAYALMTGGLTAIQVFAIGALAYNFFALIVAPLIGKKVQPIELGDSGSEKSEPERTPKHPALTTIMDVNNNYNLSISKILKSLVSMKY